MKDPYQNLTEGFAKRVTKLIMEDMPAIGGTTTVGILDQTTGEVKSADIYCLITQDPRLRKLVKLLLDMLYNVSPLQIDPDGNEIEQKPPEKEKDAQDFFEGLFGDMKPEDN